MVVQTKTPTAQSNGKPCQYRGRGRGTAFGKRLSKLTVQLSAEPTRVTAPKKGQQNSLLLRAHYWHGQ